MIRIRPDRNAPEDRAIELVTVPMGLPDAAIAAIPVSGPLPAGWVMEPAPTT